MDIDKCPRCRKTLIDEWELFEHERSCSISCFNCEYKRVAPSKEPCVSCRNRSNWKEKEGVQE
jgi:hypothetical protein